MLADVRSGLANACMEFLTSTRRYTVVRAPRAPSSCYRARTCCVRVRRRLRERIANARCSRLRRFRTASSAHCRARHTTRPTTHHYRARFFRQPAASPRLDAEPTKKALAALNQTVSRRRLRRPATVCSKRQCMEGVIPPQAMRQRGRKTLRAARRRSVRPWSGSRSATSIRSSPTRAATARRSDGQSAPGRTHPAARHAACDPTRGSVQFTGKHTDGTRLPNPCELTNRRDRRSADQLHAGHVQASASPSTTSSRGRRTRSACATRPDADDRRWADVSGDATASVTAEVATSAGFHSRADLFATTLRSRRLPAAAAEHHGRRTGEVNRDRSRASG